MLAVFCTKVKFIYFCAPVNDLFMVVSGGSGDVAQLVEQRTENPCVGGSIPSITTKASDFRGFFRFTVPGWYIIKIMF